MTTRYKGFAVALAADIRDDDAEDILTALRQIRGVADVRPIEADFQDHMIRMREQQRIREALYQFMDAEMPI